MTAYSFMSHALRERIAGDRTPLITIKHGHPLNNDHRAPFASGATAARALLVHAQRQLSDPQKGPEFFNRLRNEFDKGTINGQRVRRRLQQRQANAATALANSDVDLSAEQLQIVADIALAQAEIAAKLLPSVAVLGEPADKVIDHIDLITRNALRSATHIRTDHAIGKEVDPNAWQRELMDRLAASPDIDHSNDADVVANFSRLIYQLEAELPMAIDRDEILWEVDEALDPAAVARTRDQLSAAMGDAFNPADLDQDEELTVLARASVYENMSMDEREFAATKIALTPGQRIEVGMQIVNSTPPLIRLPEAALSQGRYDVRMSTEEEARAMDALIRYAGEARVFPGAEIAREAIEGMKEIPMSAGQQGRFTIGLAVANNEAAISHASKLITLAAQQPEMRIIVHTDIDAVRDRLMAVRAETLRAAGLEPKFEGSENATRAFGGWTLPDNGSDHFIGSDPRDATIFVANANSVMAYTNFIDLEVGGIGAAMDEVANSSTRLRATENDFARALEAMEESRDQSLVAKAAALAADGKDNKAALEDANASADPKLVASYAAREAAFKAANGLAQTANRKLEAIQRQQQQDVSRVSSMGDLARATIVDLSQQQGKLSKVYVPGRADQKTGIQTEGGMLVEERNFMAQQKAQRLRNGDSIERNNLRRLYHSERGVNSILIDGSNFFREDKGAKAGMEALRDRFSALPKTATILTSDNEKNAISQEMEKSGRPVLYATAWRVSDHSKAFDTDNRMVTLSSRKTELDLGLVGYKGEKNGQDAQLARPREWAYKDLKGAVIVVNGGGSMTRDTYDAIQELAVQRGQPGHSLSNEEVMQAYNTLAANGKAQLEAPKIAAPKLARAIMQEAVVDYAGQVIIATDMGKDFHSANLIRQAIDADKLTTAIDKSGASVALEVAYQKSLEFAPSIADNTRASLNNGLAALAHSEYGQLVLASLPNISSERARQIGENYDALGDVMRAAELGEASPSLPKALHHELSRPTNWANAMDRVDAIEKGADLNGMDAITATNEAYPKNLLEAGRSDALYTMGDVDLNVPTLALVIGGNSKPAAADQEAVRAIAAEAASKGWAVALHLSGETSAHAAKAMTEMPETERPRILLIGDGHPSTMSSAKVREAFSAVGHAGGGYITATPPLQGNAKEGEEASYTADRRSALDLHGKLASGVIVVKSSGNDAEMISLKSAMLAGRPVAAVGPSDLANPTVDDLRYRGADYSANARLLAGGDRVQVMLETRYMAFQPNSIPDMVAQTADRYVVFEGSTAGMMNAPDRPEDRDQIQHGDIESGSRMSTEISWREPAEYIANGQGTGEFIAKIEAGVARQILANEVDIAAMARQNDIKFLDTSHRMNVRADVQEVFSAVNDDARDAIDADTQAHFMAQRAGDRGR